VLDSADGERGSAAVEFALVLPMVLALSLALVQVGVIARDQLVLVQAARAGAREAAVTDDPAAIRAAVERAGVGLDGSALGMAIARAGVRGDPVTVELSYEGPARVPFVAWLFPSVLVLRASAVVRQEFG
jgi:Flp pilus assembly protein TadG